MNAIQNITIGQPDRLKKPVGYTILSNLVNIIPFASLSKLSTLFSELSTGTVHHSIPLDYGQFPVYSSYM